MQSSPQHTPPTVETGLGLKFRWHAPVRRLLTVLERASLAVERPIDRLVRPQFNPLYHTGTITLFLLIIIAITGVYLTMFFQFGFDQSYAAVARVELSPVGRIIRALHRYASSLALLTALLHGWRTFFMDRFRGPRWLAWVTGIVLAILVWAGGVTGYWLTNDQRAQVLNQTLVHLLQGSRAGVAFLNRYLTTGAAGSGWEFMLIVFLVHFGLLVLIAGFFWYHIQRLNRAKWLPPRLWIVGLTALLLVAALLVPADLLPRGDAGRLPSQISIDLPFLFYLPAALRWSPLALGGGALVLAIGLAALPWLLQGQRPAPVAVDAERCTGCRLCEQDCPYRAINMVERTDTSPHKFLAVVDPGLCVSCGICVGSCVPLALTLDRRPAEALWETVVAAAAQRGQPVKLVFTCERHALHGAAPYLANPGSDVRVIPLTCIGMVNPNLLTQALEAGAAEVAFVGCPPEDCANREGNAWLQARLERTRAPRWKGDLAGAMVTTHWLPPNDFAGALRPGSRHPVPATSYEAPVARANWRHYAPALLVAGMALAGLVGLSRTPYRPFAADQAMVEISLAHREGRVIAGPQPLAGAAISEAISGPVRLVLEVDGQAVFDRAYAPGSGKQAVAQAFAQVRLPAGEHRLRLTASGTAGTGAGMVYQQVVTLAANEVLSLRLHDLRTGGDPTAGERLYRETSLDTNAGCRICHSLQPEVRIVGPSLAGVASRAATRIPGLSAEAYLRESILAPDAYVVAGYPAGQMLPDLGKTLTPEQIEDLVAFMLTLK